VFKGKRRDFGLSGPHLCVNLGLRQIKAGRATRWQTERMSSLLARGGITWIILASLTALMLAPPDFAPLSDRMSNLGRQGMSRAWIMNSGFIALGGGVGLAAWLTRRRHLVLSVALALFGLGMIGAGLYSAATPAGGPLSDVLEDELHAAFATQSGLCFAIATGARIWRNRDAGFDGLSWLALICATASPLAMLGWPDWAGLLQGMMFAVSCLWLWRQFPADQA